MKDNYNTYLYNKTTYRFYGQGRWKVLDKGKSIADETWLPINAIYIPADLLSVAAKDCFSDGDSLGPL